MGECDQFFLGSRRYQICAGQSELPVSTVNKFREMWGLSLFDTGPNGEPVSQSSEGVVLRLRQPAGASNSSGGCCGKRKAPETIRAMVEGTGVGSRLIEMFKVAGFEACDACHELAKRMNEWGPEGCVTNMKVIVADMLPRALAWEKSKVGWWARLMPEAVTEKGLWLMVEMAIATAKPLEWTTAAAIPPRAMSVPQGQGSFCPPLNGQPIDRTKLQSHILYHIMPLSGETEWVWRRHCQWLRDVRPQFNGRLIIGIVTPGPDDAWSYCSPDAVREALSGLDAEFIEAPNDTGHVKRRKHARQGAGEGVLFPQMLAMLKTDDPDQVAFYGHCKGVSRPSSATDSAINLWAEASFETLFRNQAAAIAALDTHGVCGSFRKTSFPKNGIKGNGLNWFFSGTFFGMRLADVFSRKWSYLPKHYGCVEQWPRLNFQPSQSACLFFDDVANLYDEAYWRDSITPAFERWKCNRSDPKRHLIFHCYPKLGEDWRAVCLSTFRYRDVFNGRVLVSITTGTDCDDPAVVSEWFRQFGPNVEVTLVANDPKMGLNTTFRDQLRAIQREPGIVFKGHTKGISHSGDRFGQWRENMADGCLGDIERVEQAFRDGYRTFGVYRTASADGARVMGQDHGECRTNWPGWHYPGAFYWFDPRFITESFFDMPLHYYENEAFPCHLGPINTSRTIKPDDLIFAMNNVAPYFKELTRPLSMKELTAAVAVGHL